MKQYIRTNNEGVAVLDYAELDIAARANFLADARQEASVLELDLSDPDFSNAEKAEAINSAANLIADTTLYYLENEDGEEIEVDGDTKQMYIETIISELATRYGVDVA